MTADHCIQIAAIISTCITPFAVLIWGPVLASRINHPTPKDETVAPPSRTWYSRVLKSPLFWLSLPIPLDIVFLYFDINQPSPLTPHRVLWISMNVSAVGILFVMMLIWAIINIIGKLLKSHVSLYGFVKEIAEEGEKRDTPQT
jgi:hypothetical protein